MLGDAEGAEEGWGILGMLRDAGRCWGILRDAERCWGMQEDAGGS